jgi:flagellar basal body-associated protein FliL
MEARRAFQTGARSSKQIWIVVAALLAVVALGVAGAYLVKGLTSSSAAASQQVVQGNFQGGPTHRGRIVPNLLDRQAEAAPVSAADRRYR